LAIRIKTTFYNVATYPTYEKYKLHAKIILLDYSTIYVVEIDQTDNACCF